METFSNLFLEIFNLLEKGLELSGNYYISNKYDIKIQDGKMVVYIDNHKEYEKIMKIANKFY